MSFSIRFNTKLFFIIFSALSAGTFWACNSGSNAPDVSAIQITVQLQRFDQDVFAVDTNQVDQGFQALLQRYPALMPPYVTQMIHVPGAQEETPVQTLEMFVKDPYVRHLYDTVQQVYGDLKWLNKDLEQMLQYYKYYFPKKPTPAVATVVSAFFKEAGMLSDSLCFVSLDMFLGENYPDYVAAQDPQYIRRQYKQEYIPVRIAEALAKKANDAPLGKRLLDEMLRNGKTLYIEKLLLPDTPDSLIMGYTKAQMEGCYFNEQGVWARILGQNLLYSSDFQTTRKLIERSPNAPIAFQEAPGEVGNWLGWRIVESWMKRHPQATIEDLIKNQDSQKFLEEAKYKPKGE